MRRVRSTVRFQNWFGLLPIALGGFLGCGLGSASAQPANDMFANAAPLSGDWGSVQGSNVGATAEPGEPSHAGFQPQASIWYSWTAPSDGEVTLDTFGSLDVNSNYLDTVLAVYTGTSLQNLNQVAANDDQYPVLLSSQPLESRNSVYYPPFSGPSLLRFNAKAGTTYYIAVDSKPGFVSFSAVTGNIQLNWAYHSSGVFRFATEEFISPNSQRFGTNGIFSVGNLSPVFYASDYESSGLEDNSSVGTWLRHSVPGCLVAITRIAGSSGRMLVDYSTVDGTATSGIDYAPVSGTLVFDDYEMTKYIYVRVFPSSRVFFGVTWSNTNTSAPFLYRDFHIVLTNARPAAAESTDVSAPRVDPLLGSATVRILDSDVDPVLYNNVQMITNADGSSNAVFTFPTNTVYNFGKTHYYLPVFATNYWTHNIHIRVYRFGTNNAGDTINYRVNNFLRDDRDVDEQQNNLFPLQAESDYAVPAVPDVALNNAYIQETNGDFFCTQGTLDFGQNVQFRDIEVAITNDNQLKFNRDFHLFLYKEVNGVPVAVGMNNEATVTILFNDKAPPAGSVDQFHNTDFGLDLEPPVNTDPPEMSSPGADGVVYDLAVVPNPVNQTNTVNRTIIAGSFTSYDTVPRNSIARINGDGSLDQTFNPGGGANGLISSIALTPTGGIYIGGAFTLFNGVQRNSIARLNANGGLDFGFNPAQGANGTVWSVALQSNGQIVIGGDFTSYANVPRAHVARLNPDGSLDPSFDPGANAPNDTVWAVAVQPDGSVLIGGSFTALGSQNVEGFARLTPNGTVDAAFNTNLGLGIDGTVYSIALQGDGRIMIGGEFQNVNVTPRSRIARLNSNGTLDTSFDPGIGADDTIYSINPQPTGLYYVGGLFTSFNGTHRLGFARLYNDGTVDTTFLDTSFNQFAGLHRKYFDKQGPGDPRPFVSASAVQDDGNVMIGGEFNQVGGGEVGFNVRYDPEYPRYTYNTNVLWYEAKSRDGLRNRSNVARLLGGSSPGPGNISLQYSSYTANQGQSYLYVALSRDNGFLGHISANFSVLSGLAQSGQDFSYYSVPPFYGALWNSGRPRFRTHSDGLFGPNSLPIDQYGTTWYYYNDPAVYVSVLNNPIPGDRNTTFQLANPSGADQFMLGGANIPLGGALGASTAPFTIVNDNVNTGSIGFGAPTFTVNESGTNAVITITRTNGSAGSATVLFSTGDGTATAGSNYVAVSKRLSFPAGVTNQTVLVPVIDDFASEPNGLTVNLRLSSVSGASLGLASAKLNIVDSDFAPGYLVFSSASYTTNETGGAVVLTVNRVGSDRGTVTVQCGTANGSALAGINFVGVTNTLTWNDSDFSPRYLTVPLIDNGQVGPTTSFSVSLFNPTVDTTNNSYLLQSSPTLATVNIIDDNYYGNLQFAQPSYIVNENAGLATVTVVRFGGASQSLSVNYATVDGTAVSRGPLPNYIATSGTLTFNPGVVSQSFTVPLLNDGIVDPSANQFYFNVALSGLSPAGAQLGYYTNVPVYIRDAQTYNVPSGEPDTSFVPSPGFNGDIYTLALQSNGQILVGGTFTSADSYPRNRLARFNADGSLDANFLANLSGANGPIDKVLVQSDGRVLLAGSFSSIDSVRRNNTARLMADGSLDTSFNPSSGTDNAVFALAETFLPDRRILIGGSFLNVNGLYYPGLARLNDDGSVDGSFNTNLNLNGTVYAIAVYPTNSLEPGKIVIGGDFTLVNGVGYGGVARLNPDGSLDTTFNPGIGATNAVRALAIQLDGRVVCGGAFTNFNGAPLSHIARLNLDGSLDSSFNPSPGPDDTVLDIKLQPDNRIVLVGQFTHANGVSRNRITRLMADGTVDPSINFGLGADSYISSLAIQPDGMLVIGGGFSQFDTAPRSHLARLYGGSITGSGTFSFTSGNYSVDENSTNAVITVRRSGGTSGNMSVQFGMTDGTAHAGINYSNTTATLYFPTGETLQTVTVPVMQDYAITPDLVANIHLVNPLPPSGLGDQPVGTLILLNDDSAISFASTSYRANENVVNGYALINVIRQGSVRVGATVDFLTTTNGTAVPGFNYLPVTNTLTFGVGESNVVAQVPVLPTLGLVEGDVTVDLELTNANHALLRTPDQAELTVVDVDQAPGRFFFAQTNYVVSESDGFAQVTILRTNGNTGVVTLNFATSDGSAVAGVRYGATNGSLTFQDGEVSKTLGIPIYQLNQVLGDQTFYLSLANANGGTGNIIPPSTVPITILDNNVGLGFSSPIYIASETNGGVTLVVNRVGTNGITTVSYATTNGTAIAGTNYIPASGTLTFHPGETVKTFNVGLVHDPAVTGPLSFSVNLFGASAPAEIFTNNPTTVTINDADPGLAFTNANFYTFKGATNVLISVLRSNANTGIVSVNFNTIDGTAQAGVDYIPTNGLLTFSNGIALQSFTVPIINNQQVTPDRVFYVSIFNPTVPGQILQPNLAAVTITNDLAGISYAQPNFTVNENGGAATISVIRTGFTNSTVSVDYFTEDGSAHAGINYSNAAGTLVFTNGVTVRTFSIPVIDDSLVTGDHTVALGLQNNLGHSKIIVPQSATLTIRETDGSLIKAAGTSLVNESGPVNGVIDPGETITAMFALRNAAGTNTANLVATLLATNGIVSPSAPQTYGVLVDHGPVVSRPFTFTANATNGQVIQATFELTDGNSPTNFVAFSFVVGQSSVVFSNTAFITINDYSNATPYPSLITVSGAPRVVLNATVTFTNLTHGSPADIDALLVSPAGQKSLLMAKCGSDLSVHNVTLTFDDAASSALPQSSQLLSGTYRPTSYAAATPPFPPTRTPPGPYATSLSTFSGSDPNGPWSLYIIDDTPLYGGYISNGWLLSLTTATPVQANADLALGMTASPNPVIVSSNLTLTLSVTNFGPSSASNIVVTDPLPLGALYVGSTPGAGTAATNSAGQLVWNLDSLANGGSASLSLVIQLTRAGIVTNSATVTNLVADLNPDEDTASVVVTAAAPMADLAIGLFGVPNPGLTGKNLTYTIVVTNLGPATATGVTIADTLPLGAGLVSASPANYTLNGNLVTFPNLGDLGSGQQLSATLVVTPSLGGNLVNTATTSSGIPDPLKVNNTASIKTVVIPVVVSLTQSGDSLVLSWPADAVGYVLETTTNLQPPVVWTPVTEPAPVVSGGQQTVTIPVGDGNRYYRVHGQ